MLAIFKREMRSYFTTSLGYIFLAFSLVISGFFFSISTVMSETADTSLYFTLLIFLMVIFLPILTMRSFSEERKTKTEQLVLTSPVSIPSMVLGKFFSAVCMLLIYLALSWTFTIPLFAHVAEGSRVNVALIFGNMIALILVGMVIIALGLLISSLTENQFAAIVITIAILLLLLLVSSLSDYISAYFIRMIFDWLSIYSRFEKFTYGIFDFGALIYYISLAGVFIFLTVRVYDTRRYR